MTLRANTLSRLSNENQDVGDGGQTRYFQPTPREEQDRLALPVLRRALKLVRKAWSHGYPTLDARGLPCIRSSQVPAAWSLWGAIYGDIEAEYARRVLHRYIDTNISGWNEHPRRTKKEVVDLLRRVISDVKEGRGPPASWRHAFPPPPTPPKPRKKRKRQPDISRLSASEVQELLGRCIERLRQSHGMEADHG